MIARVWTVSPLSRVSLSPSIVPPIVHHYRPIERPQRSIVSSISLCEERLVSNTFDDSIVKGWYRWKFRRFRFVSNVVVARVLFSPARTPGKMEEEEVCYDKELLPPFDGDYYDVWLPADLSRRAELNGDEERLFECLGWGSVDSDTIDLWGRNWRNLVEIGERFVIWSLFLLFTLCVGKRESMARFFSWKKEIHISLINASFFNAKS